MEVAYNACFFINIYSERNTTGFCIIWLESILYCIGIITCRCLLTKLQHFLICKYFRIINGFLKWLGSISFIITSRIPSSIFFGDFILNLSNTFDSCWSFRNNSTLLSTKAFLKASALYAPLIPFFCEYPSSWAKCSGWLIFKTNPWRIFFRFIN